MHVRVLLALAFGCLVGCHSGVVELEMDLIRARYDEGALSVPVFREPVEIHSEAVRRLFPGVRFHRIEWSELRREGAPESHRAFGLAIILALGPEGSVHRLQASGNHTGFGELLKSRGHAIRNEAEARDTWRAFCDIHHKSWRQDCVQVSPTVWHLGVDRQADGTYYTEVILDPQGLVQSWTLTYGPASPSRPFRLGVAARSGPGAMQRVSPLSYSGGFEAKTMVFETLVRRDAQGRLAPGLAASWRVEDDGRTFVFTLREGARFHDGTPVTAEAVKQHLASWVGHAEHAWLGATERVIGMEARSPQELHIQMDQPHALAAALCAINPCAVQAPGEEGALPKGSGPFRLVEERENGTVLRLERRDAILGTEPGQLIDLVLFDPDPTQDPVDALLEGRIDALVDGWHLFFPRDQVQELMADPHFDTVTGPGSSVHHLGFRLEGPTAERGLRRALAAAVDRAALVQRAEHGFADPCTAWAAPSVVVWPKGAPEVNDRAHEELAAPLVFLVHAEDPRECEVAQVLVDQFRQASLPVTIEPLGKEEYERRIAEGPYDLRLEHTWGIPYDPLLSLLDRFPEGEIGALVADAARVPDPEARTILFGRIQEFLDQEVLLVPLFVPQRIGFVRNDRDHPEILLDHDLHRIVLGRTLPSAAKTPR